MLLLQDFKGAAALSAEAKALAAQADIAAAKAKELRQQASALHVTHCVQLSLHEKRSSGVTQNGSVYLCMMMTACIYCTPCQSLLLPNPDQLSAV